MKKLILIGYFMIMNICIGFSLETIFDFKIATVDQNKVYQLVPQGEDSLETMHADLKHSVEELQKEQDIIVNEANILQKNSSMLSEKEIKTQQDKLNKKQESFKEKVIEFHKEEIQKEQDIMHNFQVELDKSLSLVTSEKDLKLVLNSQAVSYIDPHINQDITNQVVYNMKHQASLF